MPIARTKTCRRKSMKSWPNSLFQKGSTLMAIPYQTLKALTEGQNPAVRSSVGITEKQIQPAGIDLTLGDRAYRIASSFLPRENETVAELLKHRTLYEFELKPGSILET